VKNILYEGYEGPRLPREVQIKRVQRVIREELTPIQQEVLLAYYTQNLTIPQIAENRGVHKSTVSRTLHRAEGKLRRYLRY
jgi:RNA polymerase sigma factor (sigma-70 family)